MDIVHRQVLGSYIQPLYPGVTMSLGDCGVFAINTIIVCISDDDDDDDDA